MRTVKGFLRGEKLAKRLAVLKEEIDVNHHEALNCFRTSLENVRKAGGALQEAYERLGRRGRWGRWFNANFKDTISLRTSRDYRRIYREWDNPNLQNARVAGISLKSMREIFRVLRGERAKAKIKPDDPKDDQKATKDLLIRDALRKKFASELRKLKNQEAEVFEASFFRLWERLYDKLKDMVCSALDEDFYGDDAEIKREAMKKIKKYVRSGKQ